MSLDPRDPLVKAVDRAAHARQEDVIWHQGWKSGWASAIDAAAEIAEQFGEVQIRDTIRQLKQQ